MDFRALAEERRRRRKPSVTSAQKSVPFDPALLLQAHRSIRMAHTLGVILFFFSAIVFIFFRKLAVVIAVASVCFAKYGGGRLHEVLPTIFREGRTPSSDELSRTSNVGVFCVSALFDPWLAIKTEYCVFLENLAWLCTYGKKNCLTSQIYSGREQLSFGRIVSLVFAKLRSGVVMCN